MLAISTFLLFPSYVHVVDAIASERTIAPKPRVLRRGAQSLLAAILPPVNIGFGPQNARASSAAGQIPSHEGADIEAYPIVDVRFPANGLLFDGLPANEDVKRGLTFQDGDKASLQFERSSKPILGTTLTTPYTVLLTGRPNRPDSCR